MAAMKVAIIGGGNFGTAIANIAASNGHGTHLWMRDERQEADCGRQAMDVAFARPDGPATS